MPTEDRKRVISTGKALDTVYANKEGDVYEISFKLAFLIVLLGSFLCTTTNFSSFAMELLPSLLAAKDAVKYDWCSFVLNWLMQRVKLFQMKFDRQGYEVGCSGCTYFTRC